MPLSWNEIRNRAHEFSKRWENETMEDQTHASFAAFAQVFITGDKRMAKKHMPFISTLR